MVRVRILSPQNEVAVVEALAAEIRRTWPELEADPDDRIDLLVGVRSGVDVDLLIALDLATPRPIRRARGAGAPAPGSVASGLIAVEIKQLDATRFERLGNEIFAMYGGKRSERSVSDQARDAARGIKGFAASSGFPNVYVHALAWLTQVEEAQLGGVDAAIVGRSDWAAMLAAACAQNASLSRDDERRRAAVRAVRERLLLRRTFTPLDRLKAERIARDSLVRTLVTKLATHAGSATIRLAGHGGSGKTTALLLLATRLATHYGARVLILTFHHALRGDSSHFGRHARSADRRSRADPRRNGDELSLEHRRRRRRQRSAQGRFDARLRAGGCGVPRSCGRSRTLWRWRDRPQCDRRRSRALRLGSRSHRRGARLDGRRARPFDRRLRFAAHRARRRPRAAHTPSDVVQLDAFRSERRARGSHARRFVTDAAQRRALRERRRADDRVLRLERGTARRSRRRARRRHRRPTRRRERPRARARRRGEAGESRTSRQLDLRAAFGSGARGRRRPRRAPRFRIEGSGRDGLGRVRSAHPYRRARRPGSLAYRAVRFVPRARRLGDAPDRARRPVRESAQAPHNIGSTDAAIDPDVVARRWLLIPLTRAVHLLVLHVRDPESPVAQMVREAARGLPRGTVEFYAARDAASRV